jgi:hypothetical protein
MKIHIIKFSYFPPLVNFLLHPIHSSTYDIPKHLFPILNLVLAETWPKVPFLFSCTYLTHLIIVHIMAICHKVLIKQNSEYVFFPFNPPRSVSRGQFFALENGPRAAV